MTQYIAFLRAINVTNRFVKMDILRHHFAQFGFPDVETYIQSGNLIFSSDNTNADEIASQIETNLELALGFAVPTMVRTSTELIKIANYNPFPHFTDLTNATRYISFLHDLPDAEGQQKLEALSNNMDTFHIHGQELHWLYDREQGKSKFTNGKVEKLLKTAVTRRNLNTVQKIVRKYFEG